MNKAGFTLAVPQSTWRSSYGLAARLLTLSNPLAYWQRARTRKAIAGLSADQLRDIGLEEQPDGRLTAPASLMTKLMSMQ
jgi:uncharacterized protein YjiS (DUF1127 family)